MKKIFSLLILITAAAFIFTGCGAKAAFNRGPKGGSNMQGGWGNQANRADAIGEVDTISGNNISLKMIAMPTRQGNNNPNGQNNPQNLSRRRGNQGGYQGNGNGGNRQPQYTGETQTITISDSTPITTFTRGENGMKTENIKLSDIKQGDRLQIWYSDKDKKTIEKISVMPKRLNQTN